MIKDVSRKNLVGFQDVMVCTCARSSRACQFYNQAASNYWDHKESQDILIVIKVTT